MIERTRLTAYLDNLLQIQQFHDYCPNGLQVEGKMEVNKVVTGVTASLALIDAAIRANADMILVHHGLFWKGDDFAVVDTKYQRLSHLIQNQIGLLAYHLPLDAHPEFGNNAQLANIFGASVEHVFEIEPNLPLGFMGSLQAPTMAIDFANALDKSLQRKPLHISAGSSKIQKIAWCSGAAQKYITKAKALGADAYVSGEISESTTHMARELGIHYFAAGHHATERYGVQALGEHLSEKFGLTHEFIDIDNPA